MEDKIKSQLALLKAGWTFNDKVKYYARVLDDAETVKGGVEPGNLLATNKRLLLFKGFPSYRSYLSIPYGAIDSMGFRALTMKLQITTKNGQSIAVTAAKSTAKPSLQFFTETLNNVIRTKPFSLAEVTEHDMPTTRAERATVSLASESAVAQPAAAPALAPAEEQEPHKHVGWFKRHHEEKEEKQRAAAASKAADDYNRRLEIWESGMAAYPKLIELTKTYKGGVSAPEVMLKPGESVFFKLANVSLIEEKRGAGHFEGRSAGLSVPIASLGGHAVRARVGASRGHFVPGDEKPTVVDIGELIVTNQRLTFLGMKQTRDVDLKKLVGLQSSEAHGVMQLSVSNRQKPLTFDYDIQGGQVLPWNVQLAAAHCNGTVNEYVAQIEAQFETLRASKPQPPG